MILLQPILSEKKENAHIRVEIECLESNTRNICTMFAFLWEMTCIIVSTNTNVHMHMFEDTRIHEGYFL